MEKIYFHKKKLVVNTIQLKNIESVGRFSDKYFPSNCDLESNLLFSLNGFRTIFQATEKKVIGNSTRDI